jgi:hypothetical protein
VTSVLQMRVNRRRVVAGGVWAAAAATASGTALAGNANLPELVGGVTVVLQDERLELAAEMQQRLLSNGAQIITLTDDPVRMWRGESGQLLGRRDTRLLGVTRWPEFLLVRGLAAESRRHVRYQRLDEITGALTWLIY